MFKIQIYSKISNEKEEERERGESLGAPMAYNSKP